MFCAKMTLQYMLPLFFLLESFEKYRFRDEKESNAVTIKEEDRSSTVLLFLPKAKKGGMIVEGSAWRVI
jgi:hypothetical protein